MTSAIKTPSVNGIQQNEQLLTLINKLCLLINDQSFIPDTFKISVKEISDGYLTEVTGLTDIFEKEAIKTSRSNNLKFDSIPITTTLDQYQKPLILITDETELDAYASDLVRRRSEKGYITLPVIVFSEGFFSLSYGECCSYINIIDTFENSVKEKVMVFRKPDFLNLNRYIRIVSDLTKIYLCSETIDSISDYLYREIKKDVDILSDTDDAFSSFIIISRIRAEQKFCNEIDNILRGFEEQSAICKAEIVKLREQCDKEVTELLLHIKADNLSSFAVNIDLKFGKLQEYINDFLESPLLKSDFDILQYDLNDVIKSTKDSVSHSNAKLSLIGTFSSGKTTLINTFLGQREVPLRTSMGHNTAVLMHLFYEPTEQEYYDIIYKKKLIWTIVKPGLSEQAVRNKEEYNIKITNVIVPRDGGTLIQYMILKTRETRQIRIRMPAAVKIGDVLEPGQPFTNVIQTNSKRVELCSKDELNLIQKYISNGSSVKIITADGKSRADLNRIKLIVEQLKTIAGEKNITINYDKLCETIGIKQKANPNTHQMEYPLTFVHIEFECDISLKDERRKLDKNGWLNLCGDPNPSVNTKSKAFSEMPECYMLAKELQLHVHSDFLQYCSLTDTPGFGSVTEEHDATTERYIRDNTGRLLVMIAINAKTLDAKYQDLINSIDNIYNNYRKSDKKNVIFILNCFTNLATSDRLKKHVNDVANMLITFGFDKKNIYVCNLRDALIAKQETDTMMGFPSYKRFHDFIIHEMISTDLITKYKGIEKNWSNLFITGDSQIDLKIEKYQMDLENAEAARKKCENELQQVKNVNIISQKYPDLSGFFEGGASNLINAYLNNRKGIIRSPRRDKLKEELKNINNNRERQNAEVIDEICDYYDSCINDIVYYGNTARPKPTLPQRNTPIVVLDSTLLEKILMDADSETNIFNQRTQKGYYTEKIKVCLNNGLSQSQTKAEEYCEECKKVAEKYKESVIREKEQTLRDLRDEDTLRHKIKKLQELKLQLKNLKTSFMRIQFHL